MFNPVFTLIRFVVAAFSHVWPYLVITIPLAVAVRLSGASRYINRAFKARPMIAILLATAVGAFSPFCSCGVIPVIAALLTSGVPLAPVMSFWIASPSMDPEAFFLSVSTIGWELAVWRLVATFALSLSAGFFTHIVVVRGWLGERTLREQRATAVPGVAAMLKKGWRRLRRELVGARFLPRETKRTALMGTACCSASTAVTMNLSGHRAATAAVTATGPSCDVGRGTDSSNKPGATEGTGCSIKPASFRRRLLEEGWDATLMVARFMALAFILEALITMYIPNEWIAGLLGRRNPWAILTAALLGVPVYTSNLTALPMVSGLLVQGMDPAAALAFLIAGPTTTLPAMAAVWGLTSRRVFALYVSFSLVGAVLLGYLYSLLA